MDKSSVITGLSGFVIKYDSQTYMGSYKDVPRSSLLNLSKSKTVTRANVIWKMAEYVVAFYDSPHSPLDDYIKNWKLLASKSNNQFLLLEEEKDEWGMYDAQGNKLGGEDFILDYFSKKKKSHKNTITSEDNNKHPLQQIFYGAPGTGKSHEIKKQTGERLESSEEVDLPNVFRTTFHPDTDYASFVGCYKPAMQPTSKEEKTLTGKDEEIVYSFVPQVFTDAYVYSYNNPTTPTYLVIEEINRGNCAQIFGDLFQLLDRKDGKSEYKIKADKDLAKYLNEAKDKDGQDILKDKEGIKDGKLCLPANLHILATMNTSDQSLFPMDSAFKRRWEWEYVPINYDTSIKSGEFKITIGKEADERKYSWVSFIEKVNEKIFDLTQSEDKQMGNFFIKQSIDEKGFKSKVMFYLWYEVLRDETENNKYFFYKKTIVDGKEVSTKFTFKDLYGDKATETLQQFMEFLKVTPI